MHGSNEQNWRSAQTCKHMRRLNLIGAGKQQVQLAGLRFLQHLVTWADDYLTQIGTQSRDLCIL